MNPRELNFRAYRMRSIFSRNRTVESLAAEAQGKNVRPHATPAAILPVHVSPRIRAQQAVFTLHPRPLTPGVTINGLLAASDNLRVYTVPAGKKRLFRILLTPLGASQDLLFPDLDGLCAGISQQIENLAREKSARRRSDMLQSLMADSYRDDVDESII